LFNEAVFYNTRQDREKWYADIAGEMWGQCRGGRGWRCVCRVGRFWSRSLIQETRILWIYNMECHYWRYIKANLPNACFLD
jgi:hypothetical protein